MSSSLSDLDLTKKTRKTCEKISENLYIIANEPSLACYRIAEHVYKNGPQIQDKGIEMKKLSVHLKGGCYDLDYTVKAIKSMQKSKPIFGLIKDLLKDAHYHKQQIEYDNNVRLRVATKGGEPKKLSTQRFSGSFDIPSFLSSHLPSSPSTSMMSSSLARSDSGPTPSPQSFKSLETEETKSLKES